ncbi:MAG: hypothetical protein ACFFCO_07985 [Promethearchaeota archaeon]
MSRGSAVGYVISFIVLGIVLGVVFAGLIAMFASMGVQVPYLEGNTLQWHYIPNPDPTAAFRAFGESLPLCLGAGFLCSFILTGCIALNREVCS